MNILFDAFAGALSFFYSIVPNYGFAIIALTVLVMAALTPLTFKGTRSMMVMQRLQPEIKRIQARYKDDRPKANEELLKFYKENDINPMGGCLPLLVQAPIFIVLYNVLRGLTLRMPLTDIGSSTGQIGTGANPLSIPTLANFDPAYLNHTSDLYQSLSATNIMNFLGMDLAQSASQVLRAGVVPALPYLGLILFVGASGYIQQKQISGRTPAGAVNPQQQMIMKFMPLILPVVSFGLPSGLVLYFVVSNLWRIGQQAVISRTVYGVGKGKDGKDGKDGKAKQTTKEKDAKQDKPEVGAAKDAKTKRQTTGATSGSTAGKRKGAGSAGEKAGSNGKNEKTPRSSGSQKTRSNGSKSQASRANSGRTTNKSAGTQGASKSSGGSAAAKPTLQPRARKNKKR